MNNFIHFLFSFIHNILNNIWCSFSIHIFLVVLPKFIWSLLVNIKLNPGSCFTAGFYVKCVSSRVKQCLSVLPLWLLQVHTFYLLEWLHLWICVTDLFVVCFSFFIFPLLEDESKDFFMYMLNILKKYILGNLYYFFSIKNHKDTMRFTTDYSFQYNAQMLPLGIMGAYL